MGLVLITGSINTFDSKKAEMSFKAVRLRQKYGLSLFPSVTMSKGPNITQLPFYYLLNEDNKDHD